MNDARFKKHEFVPLKFAEKKLGEYAEANKLLLKENAKWTKELELAHIKIDGFTKKPWPLFYFSVNLG